MQVLQISYCFPIFIAATANGRLFLR